MNIRSHGDRTSINAWFTSVLGFDLIDILILDLHKTRTGKNFFLGATDVLSDERTPTMQFIV